ncbi:MAG: DUF4270 family protein [Rikenellaceae bacterium]|nr:DUF4270 family protein [Rikenellaceae bacterium]
MMKLNKRSLSFRRLVLALILALPMMTACEVVTDYTLGSNLVPENQQMKAGYLTLEGLNPRRYVETRLYQTDSIISSNISYGYFGSSKEERLGRRSAAFMSQFTNHYLVDSGYFGYMPIFDSAQLILSINTWGGDTTITQKFGVYEVISNDYLELSGKDKDGQIDTTFYLRFDPEEAGVVADEPLFTFELGGDKGPATTAVTLNPTEAGYDYIDRLFLKKGNYKGDYSIYSTDSIEYWLKEFKGLYIKSMENPEGEGAIYSTSLESSGLSIYGRNRRKEDPSLIQDTVGMVFYFIDGYGYNSNISINSIKHDYSEGSLQLDIAAINETNQEREERSEIIIEGMGGVISELSFTQEFFDALDKIIADEKAASGKEFSTIAFSQAMIYFYLPSSIYDYLSIGPEMGTQYDSLIEEMDESQSRLGLYLDYKKLNAVSDYAYAYEQQYSSTLDYGGYINRSWGCYTMNITGYMQLLWNAYRNEKSTAQEEGRAVNLDNISGRTIYLGPEAYSAYTQEVSFLQGANNDSDEELTAPIRMEFTYNMIR